MELIWVCWFIAGLVSGVVVSAWCVVEGKSDDDSSVRVYVHSRNRDRSGDNRRDEHVDAEEVINGLQNIRMALSRNEREYLDYACECVLVREKLLEYYARLYAEMDKK